MPWKPYAHAATERDQISRSAVELRHLRLRLRRMFTCVFLEAITASTTKRKQAFETMDMEVKLRMLVNHPMTAALNATGAS